MSMASRGSLIEAIIELRRKIATLHRRLGYARFEVGLSNDLYFHDYAQLAHIREVLIDVLDDLVEEL